MKKFSLFVLCLFLISCVEKDRGFNKAPVLEPPEIDTESLQDSETEEPMGDTATEEEPDTETSKGSEAYPFCQKCSWVEPCPEGGLCVTNLDTNEMFCSGFCGTSEDCPGSMICLYLLPDFVCVPSLGDQACEDAVVAEEKPEPDWGDTDMDQEGETLKYLEDNYPLCQYCGEETLYQCDGEAECLQNNITGEQLCATLCLTSECPTGFECTDIDWDQLCAPVDLNIPCIENFGKETPDIPDSQINEDSENL